MQKIRKMVGKAKKYHDDLIYNKGFLRTTEEFEIVFTNNKTFDEVYTVIFMKLINSSFRGFNFRNSWIPQT